VFEVCYRFLAGAVLIVLFRLWDVFMGFSWSYAYDRYCGWAFFLCCAVFSFFLTLFREKIVVYFENHTKNTHALCERNAEF
jgi:hypothetical protein